MQTKNGTGKFNWLTLSLVLKIYLISLILPASSPLSIGYITNFQNLLHFFSVSTFGFAYLYAGWFGVLFGSPAWIANIVFFFTLYLSYNGEPKTTKWKIILPTITILLALSTILPYTEDSMIAFEMGNVSIGFYFWILSFILLLGYNYKATMKK